MTEKQAKTLFINIKKVFNYILEMQLFVYIIKLSINIDFIA